MCQTKLHSDNKEKNKNGRRGQRRIYANEEKIRLKSDTADFLYIYTMYIFIISSEISLQSIHAYIEL